MSEPQGVSPSNPPAEPTAASAPQVGAPPVAAETAPPVAAEPRGGGDAGDEEGAGLTDRALLLVTLILLGVIGYQGYDYAFGGRASVPLPQAVASSVPGQPPLPPLTAGGTTLPPGGMLNGPAGAPGGKGAPAGMGQGEPLVDLTELSAAAFAMEEAGQPLTGEQAAGLVSLLEAHMVLTQQVSQVLGESTTYLSAQQQQALRQPSSPPPITRVMPGQDPALEAAYEALRARAGKAAAAKPQAVSSGQPGEGVLPPRPAILYSGYYSLATRAELGLTAEQARSIADLLDKARTLRAQRAAVNRRIVSSLTPMQQQILTTQRTMRYFECGESWVLIQYLKSLKP